MASTKTYKEEALQGTFRVSLDSRLTKPGEYFVAVKGESFDGHTFIKDALRKGARGVLEEDELYEVAKFKIDHIEPTIVGVTGSSGKSSTVTFITQLMSRKYVVSKGDLNTKLGLNVNIINNMNLDCKVFVAEMGMDGAGQIREVTNVITPHIAVITTINQTHAEKLGSIRNITRAKAEMLENLSGDGTAILNYDNQHTRKLGKSHPGQVVWFGLSRKATLNPLVFDVSSSNLLGQHNQMNLLASVAVAKKMNVSDTEIQEVIPTLFPPKGRLNLIKGIHGSLVIDDTYNASPISTRFALDVLKDMKGKKKVAILGNMLELGRFEKYYHRKIGEYVSKLGLDVLVTVGNLAKLINEGAGSTKNKYHIESSADFEIQVLPYLKISKDDVLLVKGSQGPRMEKVTKILMKNPREAKKLLVRQDIRWE